MGRVTAVLLLYGAINAIGRMPERGTGIYDSGVYPPPPFAPAAISKLDVSAARNLVEVPRRVALEIYRKQRPNPYLVASLAPFSLRSRRALTPPPLTPLHRIRARSTLVRSCRRYALTMMGMQLFLATQGAHTLLFSSPTFHFMRMLCRGHTR